MTIHVNPLKVGPCVLVTTAGAAEGSRGAAAALACACAEPDAAPLLVDVGGRAPRPTLIASASAQRLEDRLKADLDGSKVAARGHVCHLASSGDEEGLAVASAAASAAREDGVVVHLPAALLEMALALPAFGRASVLLRADLASDRALVALAARDLLEAGTAVAVLKRRLTWVAERRALFGVLPAAAAGGLPRRLVRQLTRGAG